MRLTQEYSRREQVFAPGVDLDTLDPDAKQVARVAEGHGNVEEEPPAEEPPAEE